MRSLCNLPSALTATMELVCSGTYPVDTYSDPIKSPFVVSNSCPVIPSYPATTI